MTGRLLTQNRRKKIVILVLGSDFVFVYKIRAYSSGCPFSLNKNKNTSFSEERDSEKKKWAASTLWTARAFCVKHRRKGALL